MPNEIQCSKDRYTINDRSNDEKNGCTEYGALAVPFVDEEMAKIRARGWLTG